MFEIVTTNGFRRMIRGSSVETIGELRNVGRSNTIITLINGERVFADETYDAVVELYKKCEELNANE